MKYEILKNEIKIYSLDEFNPKHIFECGQVFSYKKIDEDTYIFYPGDKVFMIYKKINCYVIKQVGGETNLESAIEYFDLNTKYCDIKERISNQLEKKDFIFDKLIIRKAIDFGYGIRILKQNIIETIVSFICSQNNHIKRIISSLDKIRENLGNEIKIKLNGLEKYKDCFKNQKFYSFPTLKSLNQDEDFFIKMGLGYRAKYIVKSLTIIERIDFERVKRLSSLELRTVLMELSGVGRKVADCILLFGFHRKDVFPVDTWVSKIYSEISKNKESNAFRISDTLESIFGELSGYVQQYLFYYKREERLVNFNKL